MRVRFVWPSSTPKVLPLDSASSRTSFPTQETWGTHSDCSNAGDSHGPSQHRAQFLCGISRSTLHSCKEYSVTLDRSSGHRTKSKYSVPLSHLLRGPGRESECEYGSQVSCLKRAPKSRSTLDGHHGSWCLWKRIKDALETSPSHGIGPVGPNAGLNSVHESRECWQAHCGNESELTTMEPLITYFSRRECVTLHKDA